MGYGANCNDWDQVVSREPAARGRLRRRRFERFAWPEVFGLPEGFVLAEVVAAPESLALFVRFPWLDPTVLLPVEVATLRESRAVVSLAVWGPLLRRRRFRRLFGAAPSSVVETFALWGFAAARL